MRSSHGGMDSVIFREGIVKRSVALSGELDRTVEEVRRQLGMSRSGFYRYCILRFLEQMNIFSEKLHRRP